MRAQFSGLRHSTTVFVSLDYNNGICKIARTLELADCRPVNYKSYGNGSVRLLDDSFAVGKDSLERRCREDSIATPHAVLNCQQTID